MARLDSRKVKIGFISIGLAASLLLTLNVFSEDKHKRTNVISQREAVEIAKARVMADGVMSLAEREPIANLEGEFWHVTFKWRQSFEEFDPFSKGRDSGKHGGRDRVLRVGGHPHVFINRFDGRLLNVFYTR
jgi:hypothetical protein